MAPKRTRIEFSKFRLSLYVSRGQMLVAGGLFLFLIAGIVVSEWRKNAVWELAPGTDLALFRKRAAAVEQTFNGRAGGAQKIRRGVKQRLEPLDLNTATEAELVKLPGIGPALAKRIVQYRSQIGRFTRVEQLLEVPGIGKKKFARVRAFLHL